MIDCLERLVLRAISMASPFISKTTSKHIYNEIEIVFVKRFKSSFARLLNSCAFGSRSDLRSAVIPVNSGVICSFFILVFVLL